MVGNIVGKEKMMVTSVFSFSHKVLKRLLFRIVNSHDCVVNGYHSFNEISCGIGRPSWGPGWLSGKVFDL